jgi:hypothetical protein
VTTTGPESATPLMVVKASSVEDSCPKGYSRLCDYVPGVWKDLDVIRSARLSRNNDERAFEHLGPHRLGSLLGRNHELGQQRVR